METNSPTIKEYLKSVVKEVIREELYSDPEFSKRLVKALEIEPNNKYLQSIYGQLKQSDSELTPKQRIAASRIFRKLGLE